MPRFTRAIKERRRGSRARDARRKYEAQKLAAATEFKLGVIASLKTIRVLLEQEHVKYVWVDVDAKRLGDFGEMIYSRELAGYNIEQDPDSATRFKISDKVLF